MESNTKPKNEAGKVKTVQGEVSLATEVVKVPIVGKVVDDSLLEFDLEALQKARPELALKLIGKMKPRPGNERI